MTSFVRTISAARTIATGAVLAAALPFAAVAAGSHGGGHGGTDVGRAGKPAEASRTIEIVARDNEFSIPEIKARVGETIRFVIRNEGELLHEFNIGTPNMHAAHQKEMARMMEHGMMSPTGMNHDMKGMDHSKMGMMKHDDPNSVLIEPGQSKELTWTFGAADGMEFACNVPGHYESGMMGDIRVEK